MNALFASRAARWTLLLSLALNVALLSSIATAVVLLRGDRHGGASHAAPLAPLPTALRRVVGPERAAQLEPLLRAHRGDVRDTVGELRRARREVERALRADPFDRSRLEQALAELRTRESAASAALHAMLAATIAELDADERAAVADRLWRHRAHRSRQPPERPPQEHPR